MPSNTILDTKVLFTYLHPEITETVTTNFLLRHYDISAEGLPRHDALGDSILISRIFRCILEDYVQAGYRDIDISSPMRIGRMQLKPLK